MTRVVCEQIQEKEKKGKVKKTGPIMKGRKKGKIKSAPLGNGRLSHPVTTWSGDLNRA